MPGVVLSNFALVNFSFAAYLNDIEGDDNDGGVVVFRHIQHCKHY